MSDLPAKTLRRKFAKPAGACSNGYCARKPTPGYKTCRQCRTRTSEWDREHRRKPPTRTEVTMRCEYRFELVAACPADDKPDVYECVVRAARVIPVEDILAAAKSLRERKAFQEQLTQELHRLLAAEVETVGFHSGVRTRCVCGSEA